MAAQYRRDVDGLRGIAVLSVLFFHSGLSVFSGGFIGVDIFFVISGFVITAGIYDGMVSGTFSYADFYARRARRILPALVVMILITLAVSYCIYYPPSFNDVLQSGLAATLSYSNFFFWKTTNYFAPDALLRPLLHTWSLSVEEQFYIFLPPFLYVVARFRRNVALGLIALAALGSFALSSYLMDRAPSANFYLLPTRARELLLGVFAAVLPRINISSRRGYLVYSLAAVVLAYLVFSYDETTPFPGHGAVLPCLATFLLICLNPESHPLRRALESRFMVFSA
jgi:peptidoglycan/LPS O-acetylase OafA/YrhL